VRDEESAIGNYLQPVCMVHGVIGDEEDFRSDEDEESNEAE
jgi:hypothetical protein